jgi:hypothetical protein
MLSFIESRQYGQKVCYVLGLGIYKPIQKWVDLFPFTETSHPRFHVGKENRGSERGYYGAWIGEQCRRMRLAENIAGKVRLQDTPSRRVQAQVCWRSLFRREARATDGKAWGAPDPRGRARHIGENTCDQCTFRLFIIEDLVGLMTFRSAPTPLTKIRGPKSEWWNNADYKTRRNNNQIDGGVPRSTVGTKLSS